jgi:Secreted repeat of unknown function
VTAALPPRHPAALPVTRSVGATRSASNRPPPPPWAIVEHPDGAMLKVGDWPLYYFAQDRAPGDLNGRGVGGVWWVVAPDGTLIESAEDTAAGSEAPANTAVDEDGCHPKLVPRRQPADGTFMSGECRLIALGPARQRSVERCSAPRGCRRWRMPAFGTIGTRYSAPTEMLRSSIEERCRVRDERHGRWRAGARCRGRPICRNWCGSRGSRRPSVVPRGREHDQPPGGAY